MSSRISAPPPSIDAFARAASHLRKGEELGLTRGKAFDRDQVTYRNIGDIQVSVVQHKSRFGKQEKLAQQRTEAIEMLRTSIYQEHLATHGKVAAEKAVEAFDNQLTDLETTSDKKPPPLNQRNITLLLEALPLYGCFTSGHNPQQHNKTIFENFIKDLQTLFPDTESEYSSINDLEAGETHPALAKLMKVVQSQNWQTKPPALSSQNLKYLVSLIDQTQITSEENNTLNTIIENAKMAYNRPLATHQNSTKAPINLATCSLQGRALPWQRGLPTPPTAPPPPSPPPSYTSDDEGYMEPQSLQNPNTNSTYLRPKTESNSRWKENPTYGTTPQMDSTLENSVNPLYGFNALPISVQSTHASAATPIIHTLAHIQHRIHTASESQLHDITQVPQHGVLSDRLQPAKHAVADAAQRLQGVLSDTSQTFHTTPSLSAATKAVVSALNTLIDSTRPDAKPDLLSSADLVTKALEKLLKAMGPPVAPNLLAAAQQVAQALSDLINATEPGNKTASLTTDQPTAEQQLADEVDALSAPLLRPSTEGKLLTAVRETMTALSDLADTVIDTNEKTNHSDLANTATSTSNKADDKTTPLS